MKHNPTESTLISPCDKDNSHSWFQDHFNGQKRLLHVGRKDFFPAVSTLYRVTSVPLHPVHNIWKPLPWVLPSLPAKELEDLLFPMFSGPNSYFFISIFISQLRSYKIPVSSEIGLLRAYSTPGFGQLSQRLIINKHEGAHGGGAHFSMGNMFLEIYDTFPHEKLTE